MENVAKLIVKKIEEMDLAEEKICKESCNPQFIFTFVICKAAFCFKIFLPSYFYCSFRNLKPEQTGALLVFTKQTNIDYSGYFLETDEEIAEFSKFRTDDHL